MKNVEGFIIVSDGKQEFENENNGEEDDVKREDGEDEVDYNGYIESDFLKIFIIVFVLKIEVLNLLFILDINQIMLCVYGDKYVCIIYYVILYFEENLIGFLYYICMYMCLYEMICI